MMLSWFITFRHPTAQISETDQQLAAEMLLRLAGVEEALLFLPAHGHDPYLDDGPPPPLAIQIKFSSIEALEAASHEAAGLGALDSLRGAEIGEQAMLTRVFDVPEADGPTPDMPACTYLVAYEGEATDMNAWLSHYLAHHPPIMARFPGIRAIEIHSRIDWCSASGWTRENAMQRNKVVFDSPDALTAALNSPVRHEMRADYEKFPLFTGRVTHFPMWTIRVVG
jgi:uncharacterized protein (TIGR02118 family)